MEFVIVFSLAIIHSVTAFYNSAEDIKGGLDSEYCIFSGENGKPNFYRPLYTINNKFIYPNKDTNKFEIKNNDNVDITCPDGQFIEGAKEIVLKVDTITVRCNDSGKFNIGNDSIDPEIIYCIKSPKAIAKYSESVSGADNIYTEIEIGFLKNTQFIQQIKIRFDEQTKLALSSEFYLTSSIGNHEKNDKDDYYLVDKFYDITNVNNLFKITMQRQTINNLLGYDSDNQKYIKDKKYYLAHGHLSAKTDFFYAIQQQATNHLVNIVPQWQCINNGNWKAVEDLVRKFAGDRSLNLKISTGTLDVTTLPHTNGKDNVELYLYANDMDERRRLPVPHLIWKLVYDPLEKNGVTIIVVNNPYQPIKNNLSDSIRCPDILGNLKWLHLENPHDIDKGYIYACEYKEAKKVIPNLPDFNVVKLLN